MSANELWPTSEVASRVASTSDQRRRELTNAALYRCELYLHRARRELRGVERLAVMVGAIDQAREQVEALERAQECAS